MTREEETDGDIGLDIDPSEDVDGDHLDRLIARVVEENIAYQDFNLQRVIDQRSRVRYVYCWLAGQPSAAIEEVRRRLNVGGIDMRTVNTGHQELPGTLRASSLRVVFDNDKDGEAFMSLNMAAIEDRARQTADILVPNAQAGEVPLANQAVEPDGFDPLQDDHRDSLSQCCLAGRRTGNRRSRDGGRNQTS